MKRTLLRSVAASALLIGASVALPATGYVSAAMAQSSGTTTPPPAGDSATPKTDKPATPPAESTTPATPPADNNAATPPANNNAATPPADNDAATPPANNNNAATPPANENAATPPANEQAGQKVIKEQNENQVLASTYIGQTVYNAQNKSIGDISDLVFSKDGNSIQAAVIGVGGFLGIGQKQVAVPFKRIKIQRKPNSADVKLVSDITADELKKAPAFKSLQNKLDEQNAKKAPAPAGTTGGATGMGTMGGAGAGGAAG
ncbi:MAG TPA: PRC-barrel domain-containing protein, partial [Pararhizobium sp.]|nr:PRC-barrel domain-containing protein [Pararhizobium sp.]